MTLGWYIQVQQIEEELQQHQNIIQSITKEDRSYPKPSSSFFLGPNNHQFNHYFQHLSPSSLLVNMREDQCTHLEPIQKDQYCIHKYHFHFLNPKVSYVLKVPSSKEISTFEILKNKMSVSKYTIDLHLKTLGDKGVILLFLSLFLPITTLTISKSTTTFKTGHSTQTLKSPTFFHTSKKFRSCKLWSENDNFFQKNPSLSTNPILNIKILDLGFNRIGPQGAKYLGFLIKYLIYLEKLYVYENRIGDGVGWIGWGIMSNISKKKKLKLNQNQNQNQNKKKINIFSEEKETKEEVNQNQSSLKELDLQNNMISSEGMKRFFDFNLKNNVIETLNLAFNNFGEESEFKNNNTNTNTNINININNTINTNTNTNTNNNINNKQQQQQQGFNEVIEKLRDWLKVNKSLKRIILFGTGLSVRERKEIEKGINENKQREKILRVVWCSGEQIDY